MSEMNGTLSKAPDGKAPTVPESLEDLRNLFESRNKDYRSDYKTFGSAMFPITGKVTLESPKDITRFALCVHIFGKMSRYLNNFDRGGHEDSLNDLSVYAQMLKEVDRTTPYQLELFAQGK